MRCNLAKYLESIYYISWKYTPSENQKNISEIGIRKLEDSLTGSALGNVYMFTIGNAGFCSHQMRSSVEYIGPKMWKGAIKQSGKLVIVDIFIGILRESIWYYILMKPD